MSEMVMSHMSCEQSILLTWMPFRNFACGLQGVDDKLHQIASRSEGKPALALSLGLLLELTTIVCTH